MWFFIDSKLYHKNDCIPTFRLECSRFLFGLLLWCQQRRHLQLAGSLDDWYKINQAINILANYKIKIKYLRKKYRVIFHIPLYNWIIPVIFCKQDIYNYRFFRYKHIFDIYENYYLYDYIYTLNQYIIAFVYIILYIFCYLCYNNIIL